MKFQKYYNENHYDDNDDNDYSGDDEYKLTSNPD